MTAWAFEIADIDGSRRGAVSEARARTFTSRLTGPADASYTIDGTHPQALLVDELASDLLISRDGVLLYRGRVGQTQDDGAVDTHTVRVTTADYRALLGRRIVWDGSTTEFADVDQETIAWTLIDDSQGLTGGDLGITRGIAQATGVTRTLEVDTGKNLGEQITVLAELDDGFDWAITPDLTYKVWYPQRGTDQGVVLDYGGTVEAFTRTLNPSDFANAVRVTGHDQLLDVELRESDDIAIAAQGRFEAAYGYTDILDQTTLAAKAAWQIGESETARPAWTVTLRNGAWEGPDHLWVGDTALLVIRSGRLDVAASMRVYELTVTLDDNDTETVSLTLGRPALDSRRRTQTVERRLTDLERR
jgi:hypothetical protein